MAAAIGAIGINLLTGATGQLSMGHAFFLAVGAYGYCVLAGGDGARTATGSPASACRPGSPPSSPSSLAGLAGGLFSPIAGRLRGAYLGIATLALIFIGQHVLFNAGDLTGGFNGRDVPPLSLFGFTFDDTRDSSSPPCPFGSAEKLWYAGLAAAPRPAGCSPAGCCAAAPGGP